MGIRSVSIPGSFQISRNPKKLKGTARESAFSEKPGGSTAIPKEPPEILT